MLGDNKKIVLEFLFHHPLKRGGSLDNRTRMDFVLKACPAVVFGIQIIYCAFAVVKPFNLDHKHYSVSDPLLTVVESSVYIPSRYFSM